MSAKKIVIIIPSFGMGGTNTALLQLLSTCESAEGEINIYPITTTGDFADKFKRYKILEPNSLLKYWVGDYSKFNKFDKIKAYLVKFMKRVSIKLKLNLENHILKFAARKKILQNLDTIIGFEEGIATTFASLIPSKRHIAWIHCNLLFSDITTERYNKVYDIFDNVICVSKSGLTSFQSLFPNYNGETDVIYNLINYEDIKVSAVLPDTDVLNIQDDEIIAVSIGRFYAVKQFDLIPQIAKYVASKITKFKWYIIGAGEEEPKIKAAIEREGVDSIVVLTGYKSNPFSMLKRANIYVCTSLSEACPMVFLESNALNTFVISNNFPSAHELLNENTGRICELKDMPQIIVTCLSELQNKEVDKINFYEDNLKKAQYLLWQ